MVISFSNNEKEREKSAEQPNSYCSTDIHPENNYIESLNVNNYKKDFGNLGYISQYKIPESHKRVADSYILVRQVFGTPVVHSGLTSEEKKLLIRFDFYPLEFTTGKQMEQELEFLKKWAVERDANLRIASDQVIQIRGKELKHLIASNYVTVKRDVYDGYKVLEKYFQEISKYNRKK